MRPDGLRRRARRARAQRRGELLADHSAAGGRRWRQHARGAREPIIGRHGPVRAGRRRATASTATVTGPAVSRERRGRHRLGERPRHVRRPTSERDRVPPLRRPVARSCRRTAGAGTASTSRPCVVERLRRPVRRVRDVDEVADRARRPAPSASVTWRAPARPGQHRAAGRASAPRPIAASLAPPDPLLPVGACVAPVTARTRALNSSMSDQRPELVLHRGPARET